MKIHNNIIIALSVASLASVLLSACGGGGNSSGEAVSVPAFSVSTNKINVGSAFDESEGPDQAITGTVSNYQGALYIYITHTNNAIKNISIPVMSGNTGTSTLSWENKGQGVYFDTVVVRACADTGCRNELSGSPQVIDVTYVVGIAVYPAELNFTASAGAGAAPPPQAVTVYYNSNQLSADRWDSSYLYLDGSGWMTYTPGSGETPTVVQVAVDTFSLGTSPGVYHAEIQFGTAAGQHLITLPVKYTIN